MTVSSQADEAVRDYLRMHEDRNSDLKKDRQRALHFSLRRGMRYRGGNNWTGRHKALWKSVELGEAIAQDTLVEYLCHIGELEEKCSRIWERIEANSDGARYRGTVRALKAFKGIETLMGLSLVAGIGDFRRFARAEQFMDFLGLGPSEHSSGDERRLVGIT